MDIAGKEPPRGPLCRNTSESHFLCTATSVPDRGTPPATGPLVGLCSSPLEPCSLPAPRATGWQGSTSPEEGRQGARAEMGDHGREEGCPRLGEGGRWVGTGQHDDMAVSKAGSKQREASSPAAHPLQPQTGRGCAGGWGRGGLERDSRRQQRLGGHTHCSAASAPPPRGAVNGALTEEPSVRAATDSRSTSHGEVLFPLAACCKQ